MDDLGNYDFGDLGNYDFGDLGNYDFGDLGNYDFGDLGDVGGTNWWDSGDSTGDIGGATGTEDITGGDVPIFNQSATDPNEYIYTDPTSNTQVTVGSDDGGGYFTSGTGAEQTKTYFGTKDDVAALTTGGDGFWNAVTKIFGSGGTGASIGSALLKGIGQVATAFSKKNQSQTDRAIKNIISNPAALQQWKGIVDPYQKTVSEWTAQLPGMLDPLKALTPTLQDQASNITDLSNWLPQIQQATEQVGDSGAVAKALTEASFPALQALQDQLAGQPAAIQAAGAPIYGQVKNLQNFADLINQMGTEVMGGLPQIDEMAKQLIALPGQLNLQKSADLADTMADKIVTATGQLGAVNPALLNASQQATDLTTKLTGMMDPLTQMQQNVLDMQAPLSQMGEMASKLQGMQFDQKAYDEIVATAKAGDDKAQAMIDQTYADIKNAAHVKYKMDPNLQKAADTAAMILGVDGPAAKVDAISERLLNMTPEDIFNMTKEAKQGMAPEAGGRGRAVADEVFQKMKMDRLELAANLQNTRATIMNMAAGIYTNVGTVADGNRLKADIANQQADIANNQVLVSLVSQELALNGPDRIRAKLETLNFPATWQISLFNAATEELSKMISGEGTLAGAQANLAGAGVGIAGGVTNLGNLQVSISKAFDDQANTLANLTTAAGTTVNMKSSIANTMTQIAQGVDAASAARNAIMAAINAGGAEQANIMAALKTPADFEALVTQVTAAAAAGMININKEYQVPLDIDKLISEVVNAGAGATGTLTNQQTNALNTLSQALERPVEAGGRTTSDIASMIQALQTLIAPYSKEAYPGETYIGPLDAGNNQLLASLGGIFQGLGTGSAADQTTRAIQAAIDAEVNRQIGKTV